MTKAKQNIGLENNLLTPNEAFQNLEKAIARYILFFSVVPCFFLTEDFTLQLSYN